MSAQHGLPAAGPQPAASAGAAVLRPGLHPGPGQPGLVPPGAAEPGPPELRAAVPVGQARLRRPRGQSISRGGAAAGSGAGGRQKGLREGPALRVRRVPQGLRVQARAAEPPADPHGREALQVHPLRQKVSPSVIITSACSPQG